MSDSFSFNNTRKNYLRVLKGRVLPVLAPREHQLLTVPKRPGAIHQSTTTGIRSLEIPVLLEKTDDWTFGQLREDLAEWLTTEQAAPLKFDDELDRTYFALLNDVSNLEILDVDTATCTISFICPDPYKYSDEKSLFIPNDIISHVYYADNLGNIDTYPIIRLDVAKKLNYFSIISGDDHIQIGEPIRIEATAFEPETVVLWDQMNTLSGWTQATNVNKGYIAGNMLSDGYRFYPETVGSAIDPYDWQGPSLKKSLSKSVKNFTMEALVELQNVPNKTGTIEIYLLNAANETVCRMSVVDFWTEKDEVQCNIQLGNSSTGYWMYAGGANRPDYWNNFSGMLRVKRYNDRWTAYFTTIDPKTGNHVEFRTTDPYIDIDGSYSSDITQVQVAFRVYAGTEIATMSVHDIKVREINEKPGPTSPPVIAQPGDVIEVDHYKNTVRRNGEIIQGLKDFGSNFFPLKPGRNRLYALPTNIGDITLTYKERYL